jgi:uncharacterized DUF497 family protein
MKFSWDPRKARANERRHRVSFEEARSVFGDPLAITYADVDHFIGELRWLTFGESLRGKYLKDYYARSDRKLASGKSVKGTKPEASPPRSRKRRQRP